MRSMRSDEMIAIVSIMALPTVVAFMGEVLLAIRDGRLSH
jgi:hypothetical protein